MVFGGKLVARHADRLDLRLRRQPSALEAVDAEHGARTCHLHQLPLHLVGIAHSASICSRVSTDPNASLRRSAAPACASCATLTVSLEVLDEQHDDAAVVALANARFLRDARVEAGKLRASRVAPRREAADGRQTVWRRFD